MQFIKALKANGRKPKYQAAQHSFVPPLQYNKLLFNDFDDFCETLRTTNIAKLKKMYEYILRFMKSISHQINTNQIMF